MNTSPPQSWLIRLEASPSRLETLASLLDSTERSIAERFVHSHLRRRYVLAHAALRCVLGELLGVTPASLVWRTGPQGKPGITGHSLEFNLSHSEDWALIAIGDSQALGVDLEGFRPVPPTPSLLAQVASPAELEALEPMGPTEQAVAFLRLWVRKEAVLKGLGVGLSGHPQSVEVPLWPRCDGDVIVVRRPEERSGHASHWRLWDLPVPEGLLAAIAVEDDDAAAAAATAAAPRPPVLLTAEHDLRV